MDIKRIITDGATNMKKAVDWTQHEFSTLHTGKASPMMVENIQVHIEAYGTTQRLKDMSAITTPDAQSIVVQPFDKAAIDDIRKAILAANIGINPVSQGSFLRCPVPTLSGERRLELAKNLCCSLRNSVCFSMLRIRQRIRQGLSHGLREQCTSSGNLRNQR